MLDIYIYIYIYDISSLRVNITSTTQVEQRYSIKIISCVNTLKLYRLRKSVIAQELEADRKPEVHIH